MMHCSLFGLDDGSSTWRQVTSRAGFPGRQARRCTSLAITVAAGPEPLLRGSPGRKSTRAEIRDLHASSCHASPWATKRDPPGDRTRHASMRIDANGRLPLPGTERASAHDKRSTAVVAMHGGWIRHLVDPPLRHPGFGETNCLRDGITPLPQPALRLRVELSGARKPASGSRTHTARPQAEQPPRSSRTR